MSPPASQDVSLCVLLCSTPLLTTLFSLVFRLHGKVDFKDVLKRFIPDVIFHSQGQDEEQVRDHYQIVRAPIFHKRICACPSGVTFLQMATLSISGSWVNAWSTLQGS
ncbi:hypothetical protein JB92DRAFT_2874831 [Gautieria morchelliformis]|nr:hypothetical protein JB92DRAFT_2874831 [Gautieria morchelliformis]